MTATSTMSFVLRILTGPASERKLVGRVEVVETGEVVTVRGADDLVALAQRLAQEGGDSSA